MRSVYVYKQLVDEINYVDSHITKQSNRVTGWYVLGGIVLWLLSVVIAVKIKADPGVFIFGLVAGMVAHVVSVMCGTKHAKTLRRGLYLEYDDKNLPLLSSLRTLTGVDYNDSELYVTNLHNYKTQMELPYDRS